MNAHGRQGVALRDGLKVLVSLVIPSQLLACGSSADNTAASSASSSTSNTQAIRVYGGPSELASPNVDVPYTDVTICIPGTSSCQTITDIQVDTGSSGLRLLASEVQLTLPSVNDTAGNPLGECLVFADTTYVWGPVLSADVQLGSGKAPSVPIQLVGPGGFPQVPAACGATRRRRRHGCGDGRARYFGRRPVSARLRTGMYGTRRFWRAPGRLLQLSRGERKLGLHRSHSASRKPNAEPCTGIYPKTTMGY